MDKEQLRIRAERRRKFIQAQADAQDSLVAEIGRYWLSKAVQLWDPATTDSIPSGIPVGPEFERFVKDFMKHNGYRTLEFGDGAIKAGAEAVAAWIDYNGQREVGRDYPNPLTEVDKDKGAGGYVAASLGKKAYSLYDSQEQDRHRSMYSPPEEWARTCPEHAGVQMRRVSDGVYQCPMSGDTYSYTDGHNVEYHVGVHNQTNPNWNDTWPQPAFLSFPNQQSTRAGGGTWEKVQDRPDLTNSVDADSEHLRVLPIYDGTEDDPTFISETSELYRNSGIKGFMKAADTEMGIADNLFGETTLHSRYCPDHKGVSLYRLADSVFQCPLDRAIYDYNKGFKTQDGKEHNGGNVADMTPDWPEFYQSPHPFVQVQKASSVKGLTKKAQGLDCHTSPGQFANDQDELLYRAICKWLNARVREGADLESLVNTNIAYQIAQDTGLGSASRITDMLERYFGRQAKRKWRKERQQAEEELGFEVRMQNERPTKTAFTNLEYRLARDLDRALRGDEQAAKVLGLISDGVFSKGKSFMEAAQAAYEYVELEGKNTAAPSPELEVSEEEVDAGYSQGTW